MTVAEPSAQSDEELLDRFQRAAFGYFLEQFNPENGLVADTSRAGAPASIAVVGFALSCYPVGVERGWMARADAAARTLVTLRFFWNSLQSEQPDATGYKGFYYHFLDMKTGKRVWQSEVSLIDTTLLLAGVLTASVYFSEDTPSENEIRERADAIYRRIDWQWARGGAATVRQGWKPESGFLHYGWDGYDEAIILYVLGLASPTHPLPEDSYIRWTATYQWENIYDYEFLYAGPLFIHHFSQAWIDFAGIRDRFMCEKNSDYFENSRRATYVQREYGRRNPYGFEGYGKDCWGITANDGPGFQDAEDRRQGTPLSRLCRTRRSLRARRRHDRPMRDAFIAAVCSRTCLVGVAPFLCVLSRDDSRIRDCRADSIRHCRAVARPAGSPRDISDWTRASSS